MKQDTNQDSGLSEEPFFRWHETHYTDFDEQTRMVYEAIRVTVLHLKNLAEVYVNGGAQWGSSSIDDDDGGNEKTTNQWA